MSCNNSIASSVDTEGKTPRKSIRNGIENKTPRKSINSGTENKTPRKSLSSDAESWMSQSFKKMLSESAKKLKMKLLYDGSATPEAYKWHCTFYTVDAEIIKFDKLNASEGTVFKRLQAITDYVDLELGNSPEKLKIEQQVIYIMWIPSKRQVIGYLEAEPIVESYKILSYFEDVITLQPTPISKPIIGISKMWTHSKYRRKGVATFLLDICRDNFIEGQIIPHTDLAFNSLTDDLILFLMSYCQCSAKDLLIYIPQVNYF